MARLISSFTITAVTVLTAIPSLAQPEFTTSDKSLSFTYAQGWKVEGDGAKITLSAPDGSKYTLTRDSIPSPGSGEPANNPALKTAAENLVKPILGSSGYAGVRPVDVDA